jgi:hypothetical protein
MRLRSGLKRDGHPTHVGIERRADLVVSGHAVASFANSLSTAPRSSYLSRCSHPIARHLGMSTPFGPGVIA